jgi:hypothetical protein
VDSSFDNATIRKLASGSKDLSPDARELLRNSSGPVIPPCSSPELHLLRAVPQVNSNIATEGAKLDSILQNAGPLDSTAQSAVSDAIDALKAKIPKLKSSDPKVIKALIQAEQ